MPIYFYVLGDEHGCLSNFARHGFAVDGVYWPTVEHYFQAQKAAGTEDGERIRRAHTPKEAKRLGRTVPLHSDWEEDCSSLVFEDDDGGGLPCPSLIEVGLVALGAKADVGSQQDVRVLVPVEVACIHRQPATPVGVLESVRLDAGS